MGSRRLGRHRSVWRQSALSHSHTHPPPRPPRPPGHRPRRRRHRNRRQRGQPRPLRPQRRRHPRRHRLGPARRCLAGARPQRQRPDRFRPRAVRRRHRAFGHAGRGCGVCQHGIPGPGHARRGQRNGRLGRLSRQRLQRPGRRLHPGAPVAGPEPGRREPGRRAVHPGPAKHRQHLAHCQQHQHQPGQRQHGQRHGRRHAQQRQHHAGRHGERDHRHHGDQPEPEQQPVLSRVHAPRARNADRAGPARDGRLGLGARPAPGDEPGHGAGRCAGRPGAGLCERHHARCTDGAAGRSAAALGRDESVAGDGADERPAAALRAERRCGHDVTPAVGHSDPGSLQRHGGQRRRHAGAHEFDRRRRPDGTDL